MKKAMRKIVAFTLAAFVLFSTVPSFASTVNDQAKLDKVVELGVLKGEGNGVDGTKEMTRYRSIVMLLRLKGLENDMLAFDFEGKDTFTDAEGQNDYQKRLMAYLKANPEIGVAGYPDGTFRPYQKINSQEFAKVLLESLKYEDPADYTWETVPAKAAEIGLVTDASDVNMGTIIKELNFAVLIYDALTLIAKGSDVTLGEELGTPIVITKLNVKSVVSVNSSIQDVKLNKATVVAPSTSVFTLVDSDDKEIAIESAHVRDNGTTIRLKTDALQANALYTLTYDGTAYKFVAKAADTTKPELTSAVATANKTVQLNFSEEVDLTALTASNYTIEGLNVVSAAYEVDADNNPIKKQLF